MSAQDNMNQQQLGPYYHGTTAGLQPGDMITAGHIANWGSGEPKSTHVYASAYQGFAEHYALGVADVQKREPRVYEVEFTGPHERDPMLDADEPDKLSQRSRDPLRVVRDASRPRSTPGKYVVW